MASLRIVSHAAVLAVLGVLAASVPAGGIVENPVRVAADDETVAVTHSGDSADDPALWVHPTTRSQSLVIGNDKRGALEVYNLDGSRRQRITTDDTFWGNVDVRQGVRVGGRTLDIVAVYNGGLRLFTVDPTTRTLQLRTDGTGAIGSAYGEGLCLYHSQRTGVTHLFLIAQLTTVRQYRVTDPDNDGRLQLAFEREFPVGSEAEGCVADDERGVVYISEEDVGLWRYGAEPQATAQRVRVDSVQPRGHLAADVEGVTLVDAGTGGYVIASAQNLAAPTESYFVAYDRITNEYAGSFRIVGGAGSDGCQRTDGITAYAGNLGASYPTGIFICQDNTNTAPAPGLQNFKLVRLEKILASLG